jgi:hypothetical protein
VHRSPKTILCRRTCPASTPASAAVHHVLLHAEAVIGPREPLGAPVWNPFLNFLATVLRYRMRPVPVTFLRFAFSDQLYLRVLAAGYPHDAQVCFWLCMERRLIEEILSTFVPRYRQSRAVNRSSLDPSVGFRCRLTRNVCRCRGSWCGYPESQHARRWSEAIRRSNIPLAKAGGSLSCYLACQQLCPLAIFDVACRAVAHQRARAVPGIEIDVRRGRFGGERCSKMMHGGQELETYSFWRLVCE